MTEADAPDADRHARDPADGEFTGRYHRERIPDALRSAHGGLRSALETAAGEAVDSDPAFADAFESWVAANGYEDLDRDDQLGIAATQRATLLLQRLLRREGDGPSSGDAMAVGEGVLEPSNRLLDDVAARLLDSFPDGERVRARVAELVRTVEREPIAADDGVLPGDLYEGVVPADDRKARGQFYTHPAIADALVRWALRPAHDRIPRVLDPAAGCGTFTVAAYRCLADRFPNAANGEHLDRVVAVDVERFPLAMTARGLAANGPDDAADRVHAYRGSFFDLEPGIDPAGIEGVESLGAGGTVGPVDAVVGNPPYVEAGDLTPDRDHFRTHLRKLGPGDATPYADGEKRIGANADAYVYFVTHATRFLRDGGRLAFVVPTKWMTSRYGEQFQGFLHDHYRIEAVVGFDARVFDDALVDTALLLLERCDDERARRENLVRFVQLHDTVDTETLLAAVAADPEARADDGPVVVREESHRIVAVEQSTLAEEADHGKIAHYLVAPAALLALLESPELTALGDLADVHRGAMTGSTAFFFPRDEEVAAHGIEDAFLRPALKSMRGHESIACETADVDRRFVDVHWYVERVRQRAGGPGDVPLVSRVERTLEDDGFDGLLSWIRRAKDAGEHLGATCEGREVWFDFGEPPRPEILFPKLLRERLFSIYNRAGAVPSNAVDCIDVHPDVDSKVLFGVLNSSITRAIMEAWGRNEAGMLQLMTYETESLPVPDVRAMSAEERSEIAAVVEDVLERGASGVTADERDRLDAAVLCALDSVDLSVERIQEVQRVALERRVGSGASTEVLVGEAEFFDETGSRSISLERGLLDGQERLKEFSDE